jgi:hypothetical protein
MNRVLLGLLACAAVQVACRPTTDLNRECILVRKDPDGGKPIPITEAQVRAKTGLNKDFIALGTVECEDYVCVRDSNYTSDAGDSEPAKGYCSSRCIEGNKCLSYDEALDKGALALRCRALLLDKEVLASLIGDGGGLGNVREPYFCARGASADGGR